MVFKLLNGLAVSFLITFSVSVCDRHNTIRFPYQYSDSYKFA